MLTDLLLIDGQLLLKISAPVLSQAADLLTGDNTLTKSFAPLGHFRLTEKELGLDGCFKAIMISPTELFFTLPLIDMQNRKKMKQAITTVFLLGTYGVENLQKNEIDHSLWEEQALSLHYQDSSPELTGYIYPWLSKKIRKLGRAKRVQLKNSVRETIMEAKKRNLKQDDYFEVEVGEEGFTFHFEKGRWCGSKFDQNKNEKQPLYSDLQDFWKQELAFLAITSLNTWFHLHSRTSSDMI
ncbi:MAG: hypothetical protein ACM3PZ_01045 [Bacillota bacterium]